LEWTVVDELARFTVFPVALRLCADGPHHLRMAVVAPLLDIDVAAQKFEGCIRLDAANGGDVGADQERWNDLEERSRGDGDRHHDRELERLALPSAVPVGASEVLQTMTGVRHRAVFGDLDAGPFTHVGIERSRFVNLLFILGGTRAPGLHDVEQAERDAYDVHRTAENTHPVHRNDADDGLDEIRISESTGLVEGAPHQALSHASGVDGDDVEQDPERTQPEVSRGQAL